MYNGIRYVRKQLSLSAPIAISMRPNLLMLDVHLSRLFFMLILAGINTFIYMYIR